MPRNGTNFGIGTLERDRKKVGTGFFEKIMLNSKLEQDHNSKITHPALEISASEVRKRSRVTSGANFENQESSGE
jgi:hypothetical protein